VVDRCIHARDGVTGHRKLFIRNIQEFQIPSNLLFDPLVVPFVLPRGVMDGFVVGFDAARQVEKNLSGPFAWLMEEGAIRVYLILDTLLPVCSRGTPSVLDALLPGSLVVFPGALGLLLGWSSRHMGPGAGWVPRKGPLIALVDRYLACPVFSVMLGTV